MRRVDISVARFGGSTAPDDEYDGDLLTRPASA
jgi:hypothetical protein